MGIVYLWASYLRLSEMQLSMSIKHLPLVRKIPQKATGIPQNSIWSWKFKINASLKMLLSLLILSRKIFLRLCRWTCIRMRQSLILPAFHHKKSLEVNGVYLYSSLASSLEWHVEGNGLTFDAEHEDAQRDNDGNVYDCNVNVKYMK